MIIYQGSYMGISSHGAIDLYAIAFFYNRVQPGQFFEDADFLDFQVDSGEMVLTGLKIQAFRVWRSHLETPSYRLFRLIV